MSLREDFLIENDNDKKKQITLFRQSSTNKEDITIKSSPSISDLLIAVFGVPMDFTAALQFGWKMGEGLCVFTGFVLTFLGNDIYNLVII